MTVAMNCSFCHRGIRVSSTEHASLKPCGCILCLHCIVIAHSKRGASLLQCPTCSIYVDGHDWERVTFETPKITRSTPNPVPRETRKREHVTVNTVLDLDPKFDSFRIFLHNLDSQDQDEYEEALGDGLIFNEMSIIQPPTPGTNNNIRRIENIQIFNSACRGRATTFLLPIISRSSLHVPRIFTCR
jgi:hypothetical protein